MMKVFYVPYTCKQASLITSYIMTMRLKSYLMIATMRLQPGFRDPFLARELNSAPWRKFRDNAVLGHSAFLELPLRYHCATANLSCRRVATTICYCSLLAHIYASLVFPAIARIISGSAITPNKILDRIRHRGTRDKGPKKLSKRKHLSGCIFDLLCSAFQERVSWHPNLT